MESLPRFTGYAGVRAPKIGGLANARAVAESIANV